MALSLSFYMPALRLCTYTFSTSMNYLVMDLKEDENGSILLYRQCVVGSQNGSIYLQLYLLVRLGYSDG